MSRSVRPWQGTEICNFGAPSPLDFFEISPVDFFPFSPGLLCNQVRKSPQKVEKIARFLGGEKSLESCHVSALSFLSLFFWKKARKTTKKTRTLHPCRTPKLPGKEGENAQKAKEILARRQNIGNGPNTVSGSTVSNTELSEFFWGSPSSGERTQWVPLSLLFVCQSELTEFFAELTEFAVKLSEFSSPKEYSRNSIPPVS